MPTRRRSTQPTPDHDVRISLVRERIRTGFWFIPLMAVLVAWVVSSLVHRLDVALGGDRPAFLAYDGDSSQAAQVLSTIAGSTLTFTGIVFSITAVALQLGSSQFSPRALRNFLRDRGTQWALALLVATFTYSLLTLRYIDPSPEGDVATPGLSVSLALILVIASLVGFVFFVSHLAQSIRVVSIIERVAAETRAAVRETMPLTEPVPVPDLPDRAPDQVVRWERGPGVILGFDEDDLVEAARDCDALLRFVRQVGDYVPSHAPVVELWHAGADHRPVDEMAVLRRIGSGIERTMAQDPMFGFRQLVDIAEKALSPAINDPTTAVQAIDRLHDLLRRIATRPQPTGAYPDADGVVRLVIRMPTWRDAVELACTEIRQYGATSIQVVRRLRAMFDDLLTVTTAEQATVLHEQIELLDAAVERSFDHPHDRAAAGRADHQGLGA